MNRIGSLFWLSLALATGFTMFMVKYAVQNLEDELTRVRKQTVTAQVEIRVLNAEWSYLTQPERLAELNKQFVSLAPIATKQLQQSIDVIPRRPLPEPTIESLLDPPAQAAPQPMPSMAASYTPPVVEASLKTVSAPPAQPQRPQRGIDDLFAQVAAER